MTLRDRLYAIEQAMEPDEYGRIFIAAGAARKYLRETRELESAARDAGMDVE